MTSRGPVRAAPVAGFWLWAAAAFALACASHAADVRQQGGEWAVLRWATYLEPITSLQMAVDPQGNVYLAGIVNAENGGGARCLIAKLRPDASGFIYRRFVGSSDSIGVTGLAIDRVGNVYVAGSKNSNAVLPTTPGVVLPSGGFGFVVKLNASGEIVYVTEVAEVPVAIAVDDAGNVLLTGRGTLQFTSTPGVFQPQSGGGTCHGRTGSYPCHDAFLMKLNADATAWIYASFLGGSQPDRGRKLATDMAGNVYVLGDTTSTDFPVTAGSWQSSYGGGGQVGPEPYGDLFLAKIDPSGRRMIYSTYLGGRDVELPLDIAVDEAGQVYLTGVTYSADFPTTPGSLYPGYPDFGSAFPPLRSVAAKFDAQGTAVFSTFVGNTLAASVSGVAVGPEGTMLLIGTLENPNSFPLSAGSLPVCPRSQSTALLAQLSSDGRQLLRATRFGGSLREEGGGFFGQGRNVGLDQDGNLYFVGAAYSSAFLATPGVVEPRYVPEEANAFVASMEYADQLPPEPWVACAANAASLVAGWIQHPRSVGTVAVGEIVTILGRQLGPAEPLNLEVGENGRIRSELGGVQVMFDEFAAPLLYVRHDQINAVVPFGLEGRESVRMEVLRDGMRSAIFDLPLSSQSVPGIFTLDASGEGQGAILNQDGTLNSSDNPAHPGEIVSLYATGAGPLVPPGVDGEIAPLALPLPKPLLPVRVVIGGIPAEVRYAGAAPGLVSGVLQVNAQVPPDIPRLDEILVSLWIGDVVSPAVMIHVQPREEDLPQ